MPVLRLSIAVMLAFVALSVFDDSRGRDERVITGDVVEWRAGQLISVRNEQTDPGGVRIDLRGADYDGHPIGTNAHVAVRYRLVGERYPVAVRVQLFD